jgi:hypothetical protein
LLENVVASFLDAVGEREFDAPLIALLRSHEFRDIHLVHGSYEFGKDVIAKREDEGGPRQYAFQSKAGNLTLADWTAIRGQIDMLRTNELSHPSFDRELPRVGVLVLTGRLTGAAPLEVQDYKRQAAERGENPLEVWDRERLIELFSTSPDAGLAGVAEGPLLEFIARIESTEITEIELEAYSVRWISDASPLRWMSILEAGMIANRLRQADRLDLACFTCLALLRGVWASAQSAGDPPNARFETQAALARDMFDSYAAELWARCGSSELDPRELIASDGEGVFLTYPVRCLRLVEMIGMYGLRLESGEQDPVAEWLARFLEAQPGTAHPISDRWAVSMLPALLLARKADGAVVGPYLQRVVTWLGDMHEGDAAGLASYHADSQEEAAFLLGGSLEHVPHKRRGHSYIATVVLDMAAALELRDVYDVAFNDIAAVDLTPVVPVPNDDASQYLVSGRGVDVPLNTSPKYAEQFEAGDGWRMAAHHDDDLSRYFLGRNGRLWDALSLSIVTRDRHWVALLRVL